ncbi:MAG: response regulator [Thermoplasmata archaeon]
MEMDINKQKLVLLVEDDANDIELIKRAFAKLEMNIRLDVVKNGVDGAKYLDDVHTNEEKYTPDLIILDLKLPKKNGHELLDWIKDREHVRKIPVVVFTSSNENRDIEKAYKLGANSYILKPVSFEKLTELIKTLTTYWLMINENVPDR